MKGASVQGRDPTHGQEKGWGFFLVFEGVEGAGKTTQSGRLLERLQRAGVPCRGVREPGGTPVGERIRAVVLDPALTMSVEVELLLLLAARAEFVRSVVRPALDRGEVVVADRYEMSTFAYQGIARGLGLEPIRRLNEFATGGLRPDAVVLLDVPAARGLERKSGAADRMERETEEFHDRVAAAYELLSEGEPNVIRVDGSAPQEEVEARILRELAARWPETFADAAGLRNVE